MILLWLGPYKIKQHKKKFNLLKYAIQRKKKLNKESKLDCTLPSQTKSFFYFPNNWNLNLIRKENLYCFFYSDVYYFQISLPSSFYSYKVLSQNSTLQLTTSTENSEIFSTTKKLNSLLNVFNRLFFIKIKFKGKGYYLYKNIRNTVTPQFGYAHRIYKYNYVVKINFLSKTKVFFYGLSVYDLFQTAGQVKQIRTINIFTGRGVRFARSLVYKKTGKISSYR